MENMIEIVVILTQTFIFSIWHNVEDTLITPGNIATISKH